MDDYLCFRCGYSTNKKSNIINHINRKKICKPNKMNIEPLSYKNIILKEYTNKDILDIILENQQLKEINKMSNITVKGNNNNINSNNTIKIVINNYNEPNIDYIKNKHYRKFMKDFNSAYLSMCKEIYFNPKHPENKSIFKSNKRDKFIKYYKNGKWQTGSIDNILPEVKEVIYEALDKESNDEQLNELTFEIERNEKLRSKIDRDIITECYNHK
jgi:hypothetical protein